MAKVTKKEKAPDPKMMALASTEMERLEAILKFGALFNQPLDKLEAFELVVVWNLLHTFGDLAEDRCEAARAQIFEVAQSEGVKTDKGHFKLDVAGTEVTRERRQAKAPDEEAVRALLAKHGLSEDAVFSPTTVYKIDQSKLDNLVTTGRISRKEIDDSLKVSYALKMKLSKELDAAMTSLKKTIDKIRPEKVLKDGSK